MDTSPYSEIGPIIHPPSNSLDLADSASPPQETDDTYSSMSLMHAVNGVASRLLGSTYSETGIRRSSRTPTLNSISMKNVNLRIGTLNCHGLPETEEPKRSKNFIRFLRSQSLDILTLQETHTGDEDFQTRFHTQFQSSSFFWSQHVGIVSLNPSITLTFVSFYLDGRVLHVTASHSSFSFAPLNLIAIYAPARHSQQEPFYTPLSQLSFLSSSSIERSFLFGDFNYQILSSSPSGVPDIWKTHLSSFFG